MDKTHSGPRPDVTRPRARLAPSRPRPRPRPAPSGPRPSPRPAVPRPRLRPRPPPSRPRPRPAHSLETKKSKLDKKQVHIADTRTGVKL